MIVVVHILFVLLAVAVFYFVFVVPAYNFFSRSNRAPRDATIFFFSILFTGALLFFLWELHRDVVQVIGS